MRPRPIMPSCMSRAYTLGGVAPAVPKELDAEPGSDRDHRVRTEGGA